MKAIVAQIIRDPAYLRNIGYGVPRSGHPEGSVKAHIEELEANLETLKNRVSEEEYWKLKFLIHVHDTFKAESAKGVSISDPRSHASLARESASRYTDDADLLNMVQYHDEGFALYRQYLTSKGHNPGYDERLTNLLHTIRDWDLFLIFNIIDGCTEGKDSDKIEWFVRLIRQRTPTRVDASWIIPKQSERVRVSQNRVKPGRSVPAHRAHIRHGPREK
jgi:hypothetical protein